jgi:hypothetical protein
MCGQGKSYTAFLGKTKYVLTKPNTSSNMVITRTNMDGVKEFYFPEELIDQIVKDRIKEKVSGIVDRLL